MCKFHELKIRVLESSEHFSENVLEKKKNFKPSEKKVANMQIMIDDIKLTRTNTLFYRDDWKLKKKSRIKMFRNVLPGHGTDQQFAPVPRPVASHVMT